MHKESVYSHISWSIQTDHRGQENPSFSRLKSTAHAIPTSLLKASGWYHMLLYIQINNLKANFQHSPFSRKRDSPGKPRGFSSAPNPVSINPNPVTYRCSSAPVISTSLFSILEKWTATEVHTRSAIQACQLSDCYEQEHSGVTSSFCKIVPPQ